MDGAKLKVRALLKEPFYHTQDSIYFVGMIMENRVKGIKK